LRLFKKPDFEEIWALYSISAVKTYGVNVCLWAKSPKKRTPWVQDLKAKTFCT